MGITKRDESLRLRINSVIRQFQEKPDDELAPILMASCMVSRRTALEHIKTFRVRSELGDLNSYGVHEHAWGPAFTTAGGLMQECQICKQTKMMEENGQ